MKQAEKFNRPVIIFIDTKGAYPGIEAEEKGQGEAIASSMLQLSGLKVPVIAIVIGEGSSGGALALGVGNEVIMLENSIYSILSPEGYASILWKDASRAKEAAEKMKLTAQDLLELNIIDKIVEEKSFEQTAKDLKNEIESTVFELKKLSAIELVENRYQKYRNMGEFITIEKGENINVVRK